MKGQYQDPLNQAALQRLQREGQHPLPGACPLLDLGQLGQLDAQGQAPDPLSPEAEALADWDAHPKLQQEAVRLLSENLTPEDLLTKPLPELADLMIATLRGAMTD
jgi:hypothetical protein